MADKESSDYENYLKHKTAYAMRSCDHYKGKAKEVGSNCGAFMEQLLLGDFPWAKRKQAQKVLRLADPVRTSIYDTAAGTLHLIIMTFTASFTTRHDTIA
jgi:hypothetical protein